MIVMENWTVFVPDADRNIAYEGDHMSRRLEIQIDTVEEWSYKLDVELNSRKNVIDLSCTGNLLYTELTRAMLAEDGLYCCQIRGVYGDMIRHSNQFLLFVGDSIDASEAFPPPIPSEFEQIEQRVTDIKEQAEEYALHPPCIGSSGTWLVWSEGGYTDSGVCARGVTPEIKNGTWWIDGVDTGVSASGGTPIERITNSELEAILK